MPLIHSGSDAAFKTNVRNLLHEAKAGTSKHVTKPSQALAIAYAVKRRGHADGGDVTEDSITADFARQTAADRTRRAVIHRPAFAFGGFSPYGVKQTPNRMMHTEARNMVHTGPVLSAVGGRTDHHLTSVPSKSYVFTADHLSSLGHGNSLNGIAQVNRMFKLGPYGAPGMNIKHGAGAPRPPRLHAAGGEADRGGGRGTEMGQPTPVAIAGGEVVVPPENILNWLEENGFPRDIDFGHKAFDAWMTSTRKKTIRTLQKLPGPAKS